MIKVYVRHTSVARGDFLGVFAVEDLGSLVESFRTYPVYFDYFDSFSQDKMDIDGKDGIFHGAQFMVNENQVYFEIVIE